VPVVEYALRVSGPFFADEDLAARFDREISTTLRELGLLGQRLVVGGTPAGVASGGGGLRGSIFTELRGQPGARAQVIGSPLFYAPIVEVGRRAGQRPPPMPPMLLWVRRKLGLSGAQAAHVAFLVARKIGRRGTPGAFMFQRAAQQLQGYAQQAFEACAARIASALGGGANA
jgi:hypothetical protein